MVLVRLATSTRRLSFYSFRTAASRCGGALHSCRMFEEIGAEDCPPEARALGCTFIRLMKSYRFFRTTSDWTVLCCIK